MPQAGDTEVDWKPIERMLDDLEASGQRLRLWWRDDDAVAATPQLERLIDLSIRYEAPVLLAVIPNNADQSLADRLMSEPRLIPAVHGFGHINHAGPDEKKQELGAHRPLEKVLDELAAGHRLLADLFGDNLAGVLVPPWNRIAQEVVAGLPALGFTGLSCFGPEEKIVSTSGLRVHNSHIDPIDWHGSRSLLGAEMLAGAVEGAIRSRLDAAPDFPVGLLTHHLIHDESIWSFVEGFLERTQNNAACEWVDPSHLFGC